MTSAPLVTQAVSSPASAGLTVAGGVKPVALAQLLTALQEAERNCRPYLWHVESEITLEQAALLCHLQPPASGGGAGGDLWRREYRYGLLYYRAAPDFVLVRDRRPSRPLAIFRMAGPILRCTRAIMACHRHRCSSCERLRTEELVVDLGDGQSVFLPFRLARPPIPFLWL